MQMVYRPAKAALRDLYSLAQGQGGYFTAKQAAELGYLSTHLAYHLKRGNFERAGHGYYRLPEIPPAANDDLVRLTFWSRNREDRPQAVASHQTALAVHELSDLLSTLIHLTVPFSFRKPPMKGVVLHRAMLEPADVEQREGFSLTTPLRTLIDSAAEASIADEHLKRAVRQALERGLVRKTKLLEAAKASSSAARLSRILKAVR